MITLIAAIFFTLSISAFCSLLEAMLLSSSASEVENLKKTHTRRGHLLEHFKEDIEETSSAILALNTIANTLGSLLIGALVVKILGESKVIHFSIGMTLGILIFSEILPKNIGILYRRDLLKYAIYPLYGVRLIMQPISALCKRAIRLFLRRKENLEDPDKEIILLAEKSAKEGGLTKDERDMISNALSLDDVPISEIMTPRTVVSAIDKQSSIQLIFDKSPTNILFARMPVYDKNIDNIVGTVRRRDIFAAKAENKDTLKIEALMTPPLFIPENANGASSLQILLKAHQQLAITVDEFGSTAGVITMEDIFEHIIGKEIFEKDDLAVDMRELALRKKQIKDKQKE